MKKLVGILFFAVALTFGTQVAVADDATAMKPVAPKTEKSVMAPVKAPTDAMAAEVKVAPMEASKPVAAKPEAPAAKPVAPEAPKAELKPWQGTKDHKAAFWLTIITPILLLLIGILGTLGFMKWTQNDKAQMVTGMIQKGVSAFLKYAGGTKAEWDDAVAKLLNDVNEALVAAGKKPMTDEEKATYKKLAEKEKDIQGPDEKASEKKEE